MPVTKKYKKGRNNRRKTRILLKKKFRRTRKKMVGGATTNFNELKLGAIMIILVHQKREGTGGSIRSPHQYVYLLYKDYKNMGATIICIKQNIVDITKDVKIENVNIHIEPLFTMDKTDIEFNDDQLVLNLPTWKKVTLTHGNIREGTTVQENANESDLQKFLYKIKELMYDENSGYDNKSVDSMIKNSGTSDSGTSDIESPEYKIATVLATVTGGVAVVAAALNSLADSANIPLIAIVTGSISAFSGGIATKIKQVHDDQKEINKVSLEILERIKQLLKYIIEPLERINEMEGKVKTHSTAATDSSSATGAPGASASHSTDTNLEKIIILILKLMHQNNIYKKRMDEYNKGYFNLRLKILLNTHTKEKLKYLSSELEKEILLLIQIMNLKTNYNTLELLEKTAVNEDLVDGKKKLEEEKKKLEADQKKLEAEKQELKKKYDNLKGWERQEAE